MEAGYEWVPFYEELAKKISSYRNNQPALVAVLKNAGIENGIEDQDPIGNKIPLSEIDPFSFFALLNKFHGPKRAGYLANVASELGMTTPAPKEFFGVPSSDPRKSWFFSYKYDRGAQDILSLWDLFDEVLAGTISDPVLQKALAVKHTGKAKLSQAIFCISPRKFFPVDGQTKTMLAAKGIPDTFDTAGEYKAICDAIEPMTQMKPFVASHEAWKANQQASDSPTPTSGGPLMEKKASTYSASAKGDNSSLNTILYGPPGTGKTFSTKSLAVKICDGEVPTDRDALLKRFDALHQQNRVEFVTFHQSFAYEDFVEGLRPVIDDEGDKSEAQYECRPGVFKRICTAAEAELNPKAAVKGGIALGSRRLFKMSLGDTKLPSEAYLYPECMEKGYILLGYGAGLDFTGCKTTAEITAKLKTVDPDIKPYDYRITSVDYLISEIKIGDLVLISDGNLKFRAIGEVTGEYKYLDRQGKDSYCQSRAVKWIRQYDESQPIDLIFGKRLSQMTVYLMDQTSIKRPALEAILAPQEAKSSPDNYVLIIDEINRANISKVLGELISLLEPDKRIGAEEELRVRLPYSQKEFGVPKNLYVIGTMNTADRSIALLDTALRRRFDFLEIEPDYTVFKDTGGAQVPDGQGGEVDIRYLLMTINDRLEFLLGRDQRIGHAYLMGVTTLTELNQRFTKQVIPLLKEYFYEDWAGIAKVLAVPKGVSPFVIKSVIDAASLFGAGTAEDFPYADSQDKYVIASALSGAMYRGIYDGKESKFAERFASN